jgi:hypothetical protein
LFQLVSRFIAERGDDHDATKIIEAHKAWGEAHAALDEWGGERLGVGRARH